MTVAEDSTARLLDIEESLERQATKPMKAVYVELLLQLEAVWPGDDAPLAKKQAALKKINLENFNKQSQGIVEKLLDGAERALAEGYTSGLEEAQEIGVAVAEKFRTSLSSGIVKAVRAVPATVVQRVRVARAALSTAETKDDAEAAIAVAAKSINDVARVARTVANQASNEGLAFSASLDDGLIAVWQPERDACIRCLNRAGDIDPDALPPEHPFCRCRLRVLERETGIVIARSIVREAERSILRGWSQPSESQRVRIDAARKLLARGTNLPKSVKDYARTAIKRGEFPRGRDFPGVR